MNTQTPEISYEDMGDEDAYFWVATVTFNGVSRSASGRDRAQVELKAQALAQQMMATATV